MSIKSIADLTSSVLTSSTSFWRGTNANYRKSVKQPEKPIKLYEFENCPYCRMVRMAVTELHLNVMIYPCPQGGKIWREEAKKLGGKAQFPMVLDENTDTLLYESDAIIDYLFTTYLGKLPNAWKVSKRKRLLAGSMASSAIRGKRGSQASPSRQPEKPLTLYAFEASPYARPVRERLSELEIPYQLISLGKEQKADIGPADRSWNRKPYKPAKGSKREAMQAERGHISSPYLVDPNTTTQMPESQDIIAYLNKTYGA